MTPEMARRAMDEIVLPTVRAMKAMGAPYKGVLFAGLMITADGPKLIEYNVRFGDPECQVLMLRLMSDLVPALLACCDGMLKNFDLRWYPDAALDRGDGGQGLSRRHCQGLGDRGARCRGRDRGRRNLPRRHQGGWRPRPRQRRPRAQRLGARQDGGARRRRAPIGRSIGSAGPDGFCRRDIGLRAVAAEKRCEESEA